MSGQKLTNTISNAQKAGQYRANAGQKLAIEGVCCQQAKARYYRAFPRTCWHDPYARKK